MGYPKILLMFILLSSCSGDSPSRLLRTMPVNDFPLYLSDQGTGIIYKITEKGVATPYVTGLNAPTGITTDRFDGLYVAESGLSRVIKFNTNSKGPFNASNCTTNNTDACFVLTNSLVQPTKIATDSYDDVYVIDAGIKAIVRANDSEIVTRFTETPSSIEFGVNDTMLLTFSEGNKLIWDDFSTSAHVFGAKDLAVDGFGVVYAAPSSIGSSTTSCVEHFQGLDSQGLVASYPDIETKTSHTNIISYQPSQPGTTCGKIRLQDTPEATSIASDYLGNLYISQLGNSALAEPIAKGVLVSNAQEDKAKVFSKNQVFDTPSDITFTKY